LIGEDVDQYDRGPAKLYYEHELYFRTADHRKRQFNERLDKYVTMTKQSKSIEKKQIRIDDVDFEK